MTPPDSGYSIDITGLYVAGPMDLYDGVETMSLDGRSGGVPIRGLPGHQLREVGYFGVFPNLLISPHPDYVLTHRIEPLAPARSLRRVRVAVPARGLRARGFDPGYAVDFWDVTNREDWAACESLQRAAASRGTGRADVDGLEGGVYMQVGMISDGYLRGDVPSVPSSRRPRRTPAGNSSPAHDRVDRVRPGGAGTTTRPAACRPRAWAHDRGPRGSLGTAGRSSRSASAPGRWRCP